jgi:hypothetical protein
LSNVFLNKVFSFAGLFLFAAIISAQESQANRRNRILTERFEKEKGEITLDLRVSEQEKQYLENSYINTLVKKKKVEYLIKSSQYLKENCVPLVSRCRNVYSMSIEYLRDENRRTRKEMKEQERIILDAKERIESLQTRLDYISEGVVFEEEIKSAAAAIPELAKAFKCTNLRGWNYYRGVFVKPEEIKDLPFPMFVKDVVRFDSGSYMIVLEAGDYTVNFTYTKEPLVKKGEITGMGKAFFKESTGNPLLKDNVLVFITRNNRFVNSRFMCR